ncbi:MAG: hypothetical protein Q9170_000182 [Blastenia crenularia]
MREHHIHYSPVPLSTYSSIEHATEVYPTMPFCDFFRRRLVRDKELEALKEILKEVKPDDVRQAIKDSQERTAKLRAKHERRKVRYEREDAEEAKEKQRKRWEEEQRIWAMNSQRQTEQASGQQDRSGQRVDGGTDGVRSRAGNGVHEGAEQRGGRE